ncbi:phage distal tail protein [Bifidobacterium oedipodis]|uniref:3-hydroxy-3-methylglutaryl CoA synthase n=1 Tax=Bifidobacterium oedipodis TaxID=2675322 RepID=A0A7Y0EP32_9BIFI|nr:hypothetical protein [Bifidobacterium sp. DSM 109957]NMM93863.1 3-hydroxy-3-methylglutaryl CoA synthase [Bifidobacterium sp. DSM 109957]
MADYPPGEGLFKREPGDWGDDGLRINGLPLSHWGLWLGVDGVQVGELSMGTSFTELPGVPGLVDGSLVDGMNNAIPTQRRTLTINVGMWGDEAEAVESKTRFALLNGSTVEVQWRNWPGVFIGRITSINWTDEWKQGVFVRSLGVVTVSCRPYVYGTPRSFETSTAVHTVLVEGNRPTGPTVTCVPPAGTKRYYLTVNEGSANQAQLVFNADFNGSWTLTVDCDQHYATYGTQPVFPSVDSDYPMLIPGSNTVQDSAGVSLWTYTPRWLL